MADDRYTETTRQSWGGRIGDSLKGIVVGLILFAVAFPLLFWNEGRSVERYKTLKEAATAVVSTRPDEVLPQNDGRLVHVTGQATTSEILNDSEFGVSLNAIRLRRNVEMYQWREQSSSHEEKKLGGGTETVTEYTYDKVWSSELIDSSGFKLPRGHENPPVMPYRNREQMAQQVTVGAFRLPPSLVSLMDNWSAVDTPAKVPASLAKRGQPIENGFYVGEASSDPKIGDMRVTFEAARPAMVSVMARQIGDTFEPFSARAGGTVELLEVGSYSADTMIRTEHDENTLLTWLLRIAGFVVMAIGLSLVLRPLSVLGDVVPVIGNIIGAGSGMVALLAAGALSIITIAIAWLVYRPLLAVVLIAVAAGLVFGIRKFARRPAPAV